MRLLELHCDYINVLPKKKALKSIGELSEDEKKGVRMENVLVVFSSFEEGDDESVLERAVVEIQKNFKEVNADSVLVYPYAHLSHKLAKPALAQTLLDSFLIKVRAFAPNAQKSPFGYYKEFELKCKGHPLAELSKTITSETLQTQVKTLGGKDAEVFRLPSLFEDYGAATPKTLKPTQTLEARRNTALLLLAHAVQTELGGKATTGFGKDNEGYLDFEGPGVSPETLNQLESAMHALQQKAWPIELKKTGKNAEMPNRYLNEALSETKAKEVLVQGFGKHTYFLPGPFTKTSQDVSAFALTKFGGSYWKNNSKNAKLQRVHVQVFKNQDALLEFKQLQKEAEARDHRKIGKQLDLFSIHEEGVGFIFYHPNGMTLYKELEKFLREQYEKRGYQEIKTPLILNEDLWRQSGHWDHYHENMYFTEIDGVPHAVKPMNCPGAILVYKTKPRSYRELPLRLAENGVDHRHELSGVLSGLFRVRAFTQDDAHLFVTEDQILDEVKNFIDFIDFMYKTFGFSYSIELSTKPEKAMGDPALWEKAESALKKALEKNKKKYEVNEGDGAFYGPKIDFKIKDALGRLWQCGTIQLDFQMPERFDLHYEGPQGKKRPVMLHRVIYGSFERFLGILIEHFAGSFPTWLSPEQVRVLALTDHENAYAEKVRDELRQNGIRATADISSGKIEGKIRDAQLFKVPYMLVVGKKETESKTVSVRKRDGTQKHGVKQQEFMKDLLQEIRERRRHE
ncbi:threonine--tRNA ligase [Candidatus Micrarchaeota archaeon]|nr:threonine--tRNA ligase [Candidatus Micrarchaeota archaeon]